MPTANETRLQAYLDAEAKILRGQRTRGSDGRELQYADLAEIRKQIASLQLLVARESATALGGGSRFSQADFGGTS